jgi:hypothetical protein
MRDVAQHVAQREQYRRSTGRKSLLRQWNLSLLSLSSVRAHLLRGVSEPAVSEPALYDVAHVAHSPYKGLSRTMSSIGEPGDSVRLHPCSQGPHA